MEDSNKKQERIIRTFNVNKESYELLTSIAEEEDVSVSHIVRDLIDRYIASYHASNKASKQETQP